jgi:endonuclease-8
MPEGDTIWRTARTLGAALAGRVVTAFGSSLPAVEAAAARLHLVGRRVEAVEVRGKHLLVRFEGGLVLHTHQGMHGAWRLRADGTAGAPAGWSRARARIAAGDIVAACFAAPVVELLPPRAEARHPALRRLGPDLLAGAFDAAAARSRLRARGDREVGAALLDQTALAGIGNVYKSETLFLCGVPPRALVRDLGDASLDRLIAAAQRLLRRNLGPGPRRTTSAVSPTRTWVYGRTGSPCHRCRTPILRLAQGDPPRSTYFCPRCQGDAASGTHE